MGIRSSLGVRRADEQLIFAPWRPARHRRTSQGIKGNEIQHPGEENNINNNNIITKRLHPPASAPAKLQDCVITAPGRLHLLSTAPGSSWKSQATAAQGMQEPARLTISPLTRRHLGCCPTSPSSSSPAYDCYNEGHGSNDGVRGGSQDSVVRSTRKIKYNVMRPAPSFHL